MNENRPYGAYVLLTDGMPVQNIPAGFMIPPWTDPQKKEQKRLQAMIAAVEIGDYVLTNSGFYGSIIDVTEDTVIVEFGNNKNCRIPMQKSAIAQIEKPDAE